MESLWAHVRRVHNGTYSHISPKYLHSYITEAAERLNVREMNVLEKMAAVARNMVGRTLAYRHLIARNSLCGVQ